MQLAASQPYIETKNNLVCNKLVNTLVLMRQLFFLFSYHHVKGCPSSQLSVPQGLKLKLSAPAGEAISLSLPTKPISTAGFWAASAHNQLMSRFSSSSNLHSIALSPLFPRLYWYWGLPQPRGSILPLALLNHLRLPQTNFLNFSRSLRIASYPSNVLTIPLSLVSSTDLLRMHSIPLDVFNGDSKPASVQLSEGHPSLLNSEQVRKLLIVINYYHN